MFQRLLPGAIAATAVLMMSIAATEPVMQGADDFNARLQSLAPGDPMAYFDLAEEIADQATSNPQRDLARQLFKLAGVLDRERLGRSACLALADLSDDRAEKRRYLAIAQLLDRRGMAPNWLPGESAEQFDAADAVALSRAFGFYRSGNGRRALGVLRESPGAESLFRRYGDTLGGVQRFITNAEVPQYNDGATSPLRTEGSIAEMLEVEAALLAADDPTWAMDLLLHGGRTLIEVDPDQLAVALGVDPRAAFYRNGNWVTRP